MTFADLFILGLLAHLFADWFLQNDWQAANKVDLRHPAAWVHCALHLACLAVVWPLAAALAVALSHALIDTRKPLVWWRILLRQKQWRADQPAETNAVAVHVAFWQDQAAHLLVLGFVAAVMS
ncbi:MAG TPA: DUF3307 domain-containing protein [Myxococcota bacterium]|nr:DUF3307 domain-containing protein [Myxococcota bacterium]